MQEDVTTEIINFMTSSFYFSHHTVNLDTLQFLKKKAIPNRQVQLISFEEQTGQHLSYIFFLVRNDSQGWQVKGAVGSAENGYVDPEWSQRQPWASLDAGLADGFYAGGKVINNNIDISLARLVWNNGVVLEDSVEDNLVLFVTDKRLGRPDKFELYKRSGELAASHRWFGSFSIHEVPQ